VLLLDTMRACAWANYRYFHDWPELAPEDQAYIIAAYQTDLELHALTEYEASENAKQAAKKKTPKKPGS
jgi:hypothetical protein